MRYMNILNNLDDSYNRKIQVRLFKQMDMIDEAKEKCINEKNKYKLEFLKKANPITLNIKREKVLSRGYRKDYRRALKRLRTEYVNQLAELKENKNYNLKEEKQYLTLVMSKINSNYKKTKQEYLVAIKEGKGGAESKFNTFEQQFKEYYQDELEKRTKVKETNISNINNSFQEEATKIKIDYEEKRNALKTKHQSISRLAFKKEKRILIKNYKTEIIILKSEMMASEIENNSHLKSVFNEYKATKKAAKQEIKKIKKEAKITVSKMSVQERREYKELQKYIREDFRFRRLKKIDEKEKAILKDVNPAYIYIAPAFFGALLFTLVPCIFMIIGSMFRINFTNLSKSKWVGLNNFRTIFKLDVEFQKAVSNTALFAFITIILLAVITISMAAWLSKNTKIHNMAQTMVFTPHIASLVSISILWIAMLNPTGIINQALALFGIKGPAWLLQENTSLFSVSLVTVWKDIGYYVLIIIAGLQGIPTYVYEAAKLDKASKRTTFFRITLPLLAPTLSFVFLAKFINAFKVFAPIEIMTNGGPMGSSMVLSYWIYKVGRIGFNYGLAMAGAIILTIMIAFVTVLKNIYFNKVTKY